MQHGAVGPQGLVALARDVLAWPFLPALRTRRLRGQGCVASIEHLRASAIGQTDVQADLSLDLAQLPGFLPFSAAPRRRGQRQGNFSPSRSQRLVIGSVTRTNHLEELFSTESSALGNLYFLTS